MPGWSTPRARRDVVLLGSTGSIGTQAADIIRRNPGRFRVAGLAAGGGNPDLLASQALEFGAEVVAVASDARVGNCGRRCTPRPRRRRPPGRGERGGRGEAHRARRAAAQDPGGPDAVAEVAAWPCDVVLNGVTGAVGLAATLAAIDAGHVLALANKESLIMGGPLVAGRAAPGQIVPVDSEHSALAQCLRGGRAEEVRRLVVTASGGPFLHRSRDELEDVTPEQALAHPTWNMGPVVTVNSATLVNKGLELIEAHLLFGIGFEADRGGRAPAVGDPLDGRVHRRLDDRPGQPAGHAASRSRWPWPGRTGFPMRPARWTGPRRIPGHLSRSTRARSPQWHSPAQAGTAGGTAPAVYNAANEVCVEAFLSGRLPLHQDHRYCCAGSL